MFLALLIDRILTEKPFLYKKDVFAYLSAVHNGLALPESL